MSGLQNEIKRLSNLKNYKNYDKSSLEKIAQLGLWKKQANIAQKFENKGDKKVAEEFFNNYLANYEFVDYNDIQNVVDLVYEEVLLQKVQKDVDKIVNDDKNSFVPDKLIQSMHSIQERIWQLKEKAGIVGKKEKDELTASQEAEKKFRIHIAHNRNEFTFWSPIPCEDCGSVNVKPVLIRKRCNKENYDILKHPHFSGRFWYNKRGMSLVKANIWTKERYAWVFHTSVKYVDWCLENEHKIVQIDDVEDKEIQDFINNTEYLKDEAIPKNIL